MHGHVNVTKFLGNHLYYYYYYLLLFMKHVLIVDVTIAACFLRLSTFIHFTKYHSPTYMY